LCGGFDGERLEHQGDGHSEAQYEGKTCGLESRTFPTDFSDSFCVIKAQFEQVMVSHEVVDQAHLTSGPIINDPEDKLDHLAFGSSLGLGLRFRSRLWFRTGLALCRILDETLDRYKHRSHQPKIDSQKGVTVIVVRFRR
jgi:hypothetical protein